MQPPSVLLAQMTAACSSIVVKLGPVAYSIWCTQGWRITTALQHYCDLMQEQQQMQVHSEMSISSTSQGLQGSRWAYILNFTLALQRLLDNLSTAARTETLSASLHLKCSVPLGPFTCGALFAVDKHLDHEHIILLQLAGVHVWQHIGIISLAALLFEVDHSCPGRLPVF